MAQARYEFALHERGIGSSPGFIMDLTGIASDARGAYRLNRPAVWTIKLPADNESLAAIQSDGLPALRAGARTLQVYRRNRADTETTRIFSGIIWRVGRVGGEDEATIQVTAVDPMIWWQSRPVRDDTGNFSDPTFASPISGAEIIKAAVDNSTTFEGTLQLNTASGTFDTTIPPAVDLAAALSSWPITIGDLATLLTDTGMVDIWIEPSLATNRLGFLHVVNQMTDDLWSGPFDATPPTGDVHFDYATGDHSLQELKHSEDMSTLCNRLWYYLGPKLDPEHWRGNITGDDPGLPDPPQSTLDTLISDSRDLYGVFMDVQVYDDRGTENDARPLFQRLWQTETLLRVKPRELVEAVPVPNAEFVPFEDYFLGSIVDINAGARFGYSFSASQRVYGFDVNPDDENVERVGNLIASADAE